ncbi:MAG: FHA domain-containing protein [Polyangia bacterium]
MKIESQAQAEELLRALSAYYQEPVLPISRYCSALEAWAGCIQMNNYRRPSAMIPEGFAQPQEDGHGATYAAILPAILTDIRKSNLLYRLIYRGQPLRKRPCPQHRGHWSGWSSEPCPHGCSDGMNVTGWLPEPAPPPAAATEGGTRPAEVQTQMPARLLYTDAAGKACSVEVPPQGGYLGRAAECLVSAPDLLLGRRQSRLQLRADGWYVEDLSSVSGTFLNEQRLHREARLKDGDVIRCGSLRVRFVAAGKPAS